MEEIRKQLGEFRNSLNNIEDEKYKDYFSRMTSIMDAFSNKVEEVIVNMETIEENVDFMDKDLSNIQDELFEEVSIEELNDIEDEYKEINCVHCNKPIFIEQSALDSGKEIPCPYCHKNII